MARKTLRVLMAASFLFGYVGLIRADISQVGGLNRHASDLLAQAPQSDIAVRHDVKADQQSAGDSLAADESSVEFSTRKTHTKVGKHDWLTKHPTILKLLKLQNQERARNGLPPLTLNPDMCLAAQQHAVWMAKTGYYMHSSLPWAEIIFNGPRTPEAAVNGWIWSPAHHSIMLSGSEAGFGYMVIDGRTYWVGVFR